MKWLWRLWSWPGIAATNALAAVLNIMLGISFDSATNWFCAGFATAFTITCLLGNYVDKLQRKIDEE